MPFGLVPLRSVVLVDANSLLLPVRPRDLHLDHAAAVAPVSKAIKFTKH